MNSFNTAITRVAGIGGVDEIGAIGGTGRAGAMSASAMPQAPAAIQGADHAMLGTPPVGTTEASRVPPPASAESTERFKQMMEHASVTVQSGPYHSTGPSAMSEVVSSQDAAFNELMTSMQTFEKNAPSMDPKAFAAQAVRMQFDVATAMMKMEIGVGFAQGGKGAVQSLMKNQ